MEHSNEKQHSSNIPAYEVCIQALDQASQDPRDVVAKIGQFNNVFADGSWEDVSSLGRLTKGVLTVLRDTFDESDVASAQKMFIQGAMTGLYLGGEMTDGYVSLKDILAAGHELIKDDPYHFADDATGVVSEMSPATKQIVDKWKQALDIDDRDSTLFDSAFGIMICSVNRAMHEIDMLKSLDWELADANEPSPIALQSVDNDCLRLAQAFQDHIALLGTEGFSDEQMQEGVRHACKLLERDIELLEDLRLGDRLQTRGVGLLVAFDENELPDDLWEYGENATVKGRLIRTEGMLVPSEFSVLMGTAEEKESHEPQVCLILDTVEIVDGDGMVTPYDGIVAVPLRPLGTQLDRLIFSAEG